VVSGRTVVAAGTRGQVSVDLRSGRRLWTTAGTAAGHGCDGQILPAHTDSVFCATSSLAEERDLRTGLVTRVFDPQFGPLGAVAFHRAADGSQSLVEFQYIGQSYARWNLDGPGLGARLLLPGGAAVGGYDTGGTRWLATARDGTTSVRDDRGRRVLRLPERGTASWIAPDTVAVVGHRAVLVTISSGRRRTVPVPRVVAVFPGGGTQAWAVSEDDGAVRLTRFDVDTLAMTAPSIELAGVKDVRVAADDRRVLLTYRSADLQGFLGTWETQEFNADTGAFVTGGMYRTPGVALAPDGSIVGGRDDGIIETRSELYLDGEELWRARSAVVGVQVSRDQTRVLAVSADENLHLVDWFARTRLGDPIPTQPPDGAAAGWLRPDGKAMLVNTRQGVVLWDLDPAAMADSLCAMAGRNPQYAEWETFFGELDEYDEPVCPGYPTAADQVDQTS
jgi:hypothetical protein